jgi:hypothetical protein
LDSAAGRAVFKVAAKTEDARPADCAGLPQGACSADQVQAQLQPSGSGWALQLDIAPGFHVNANPASLPNLIATTVLLDGHPLPGVRYPPPQTFRPAFAPQAIAVWEGRVRLELPALNPQQLGALTLRVQACSATTCLAPSAMRVGRPALFSAPETLRRAEAE